MKREDTIKRCLTRTAVRRTANFITAPSGQKGGFMATEGKRSDSIG